MPRRSRWCEQDALGIDVPTDGEIRRENYIHYHCRHLVGIDFATLTEKRMRGHYQALLPTITGPVRAARQPFLVRDWQIAQSATRKPVKITLPGCSPSATASRIMSRNGSDAGFERDARFRRRRPGERH